MNSFQPLISVIINCFNGEKYLREAIDSVIAQTYTNWEVLFWDNQSTDSTKEIVHGYNDARIKYHYAEYHTTLGEARNLAVEKAAGEYINFLDVDDVWGKSKLEEQVRLLIPKKTEVIYTPFKILLNPKEKYDKSMVNYCEKIVRHEQKTGQIFDDLLKGNFIIFSSALLSRDLYLSVGGINNQFKHLEDLDILLKLCQKTNFDCANSATTLYRIHASNNTIENRFIGLEENSIILKMLPQTENVRKAVTRNYTRIAFYTITIKRQYTEGFQILFKKGSVLTLVGLVMNKIFCSLFS